VINSRTEISPVRTRESPKEEVIFRRGTTDSE
jgi:hypothetical protein